jgi:hypothetical protein
MPPRVNARLPLSLLEAVRVMDAPEVDTETEYVQELRNKRLGLSDTVYQQIQRYSEAVKRGQGIWYAEATGLATLIGRRPDAAQLYLSAGQILAKEAFESISAPKRKMMRVLPSVVGRRLALRELRKITTTYFRGTLSRSGGSLSLAVPVSVTVNSAPNSLGCTYYAAALGELLKLLIDGDGPIEHERCLQRGDNNCEWRAAWRGSKSGAN